MRSKSLTILNAFHEIHDTCYSVTFFFHEKKTHFLKLAVSGILPNMIWVKVDFLRTFVEWTFSPTILRNWTFTNAFFEKKEFFALSPQVQCQSTGLHRDFLGKF